MAGHPPVAGAIKVELLWTQGSVPAANVMYAGYSTAPPTSADLATFAAALQLQLKNAIQGFMPPQTTCTEVLCTDLSSPSGAVGSSSTAWNGTDTTGNFLSAGSSLMVNWHIGRRYRGGKCRTYFPAPEGDHLSNASTWAASFVTAWAAALPTFVAAFTGTYGALTVDGLVCVSYFGGVPTVGGKSQPRVVPLVEPITGFAVSGLIRTQRRRITASTF